MHGFLVKYPASVHFEIINFVFARDFAVMLISCVQNSRESFCFTAIDHSVQSPCLCQITISILIRLPAAVGGSEAIPMLDSVMT
jgi:hypothetical protein